MSFQEYAESHGWRGSWMMGGKAVLGIVVVAALVLICVGSIVLVPQRGVVVERQQGADEQAPASLAAETLLVHVVGCVQSPGVYELPAGSRVSDAVAAAGGLSADADEAAVNQARAVSDGEQIVIPGKASADVAAVAPSGAAAAEIAGKVNINVATADQLQTVSGIGPSIAQKIVSEREKNGPFQSVDDLVRVSGIGEKKLADLRDKLCVA